MISKKSYKYILSLLIIVLTYGYIFYKLSKFEYLDIIFEKILSNSINNIFLLFLTIILMTINWSIEAIKWKYLLRETQNISFFHSLKGVLSGVSVGIFTPNRVGEIGGRMIVLEKQNRKEGIIATALGSYSQFITSLIFGVFSLTYFILFIINPATNTINTNFLILFSSFLLLVTLYEYFTFKISRTLVFKIKILNTFKKNIQNLISKKKNELFIILIFSIIRYFVFLSQFYLMLLFFDINISFTNAFISISITYLVMTIIPTTTLAELGIRGSVAIIFIGLFTTNTIAIIMASIMVWIINIAIPAILGTYNYLKLNKFLNTQIERLFPSVKS